MTIDELLDIEMKKKQQAAQQSTPAQPGRMTIDQLIEQEASSAAPGGNEYDSGNYWGDIARSTVGGATFGLDDEIFGALGSSTIDEERARKEKFEKAHPWASMAAKVGGGIAGSLLPVGWLARMGGAGRAVAAAYPMANAAKVAQATTKTKAAIEGAKVGAKAGAFQTIGDAEGNVLERPFNVIGDGERLMTNVGTGILGGGVLGGATKGARDIYEGAKKFGGLGRTDRALASDELRGVMERAGRSLDDVYDDIAPGGRISARDKRSTFEAYAKALENGANERAARVAAADKLAKRTGMKSREAQREMTALFRSAQSRFDEAPLILAERIAGGNAPMSGAMKGRVQSLLYNGGEGTSGSPSDILSKPINARQMSSIDRLKGMVGEVGDAGPPGAGKLAATNAMTAANKKAADAGFGAARAQAKMFDIEPALSKHIKISKTLGGDMPGGAHHELTKTVDDWVKWSNRVKDWEGNPEEYLNAFIQARRQLGQQIQALKQGGNKYSASVLTNLKRDLDAVAMRKNRKWWKANREFAEGESAKSAWIDGYGINLRSMGDTADAKEIYRGLNGTERKAFRDGLARKMIEMFKEPTHDNAKAFMAGGADEMEEGLRGLIVRIVGRDQGEKLLRRIANERQMTSTRNLAENSATERIAQINRAKEAKGAVSGAMRFLSPRTLLENLSKAHGMEKMANVSSEEARLLAAQGLPESLKALRSIGQVNPNKLDDIEQKLMDTRLFGNYSNLQIRDILERLQGGMAAQMPSSLEDIQ